MSKSDTQWLFLQDVARLILFAISNEFKLTLGEGYRPQVLQQMYYDSGASKTLHSKHRERLAIDFNIFAFGVYLNQRHHRNIAKPLGDYWEGLNPKNRWGGSWRGLIENGESDFIDIPHFERME